MSVIEANSEIGFYVTGGTLHCNAPCYVQRQADNDLYDGLRRSQFCYVLTSRQMGKSSLMVRTAARLRESGAGVALLDLTAIGQNISAEQWYCGLLSELGQQLELEDELGAFWRARVELGPLQRWMRAVREIMLPRYPGQLVIFVDEIDSVRNLPFSTDEFFAAIREFYNRRTKDGDLARLTFCLLGVAAPSDLIRDTRTTPFNIGNRIELHDFTEGETATLAQGLNCKEKVATSLLKRVYYWTGGHPYLTQRLCQTVAEQGSQLAIRNPQFIDRLCEELFFSPRAQERDDNLLFVRERMLRGEVDLPGLLHLYDQVLRGKRVRDDETSPLVSVLRLSGLAGVENGRLRTRNPIYNRVFGGEWVKANMPDAEVRRQRAAYRRGVLRATAVAAVVLAVIGGLALYAFKSRQEALAQSRIAHQQRQRAEEEAHRADYNSQQANLNAQNTQAALTAEEKQRQFAEEQRGLAEQRQIEAEEQRNRALEQEQNNHWLLYAAQLNLAQQALAENNFGRARELLTLHIPQSGQADLRGFEWYHLWQRCCGTAFAQHASRGSILLAYSPDGASLATALRQERTVKIWDAHTGRELSSFSGYTTGATAIAYSPNGQWLATGGFENTIKLRHTVTGRERLIQSQPEGILSLAFSPDGRKLASGNLNNTVSLWDVATGQEIVTLKGHGNRVKSVAFSPDGSTVASGSFDNTVKLWEVSSQRELATLTYPNPVTCVAFSLDGKLLAAGGWGGMVKFWETATQKETRVLAAHTGHVLSLAFSADGAMLATGSADRTAKLWAVATGQRLAIFSRFTEGVSSVAFSPESGNLAVASSDGTIKVWDTVTQQELQAGQAVLNDVQTVAFSPDGKVVATGSSDFSIKLWDPATGKPVADLLGHRAGTSSVAFFPDGTKLASVSLDRVVKIWDVATHKQLTTFTSQDRIQFAAFSPDGKKLALAGRDHTVRLRDTTTWQEIAIFQGHADIVWSVAFSPNGGQMASASRDGTVILWDVVTGHAITALRAHARSVNSIAFSPDGGRLVTGSSDNTAKLWDVATGKELKIFQGHANAVMAVKFSPDGTRLATAGRDHTIKLWEINRGLELLSLKGHQNEVWSLAFSSNGYWLASSGADGTARLWQATPEKEVVVQQRGGRLVTASDAEHSPRRRREFAAPVPHP